MQSIVEERFRSKQVWLTVLVFAVSFFCCRGQVWARDLTLLITGDTNGYVQYCHH